MRLLGAFNHVHVFLDPDPDPKTSFEERVRLFKAERKGGWENYNPALISKGGGIFERSAKSIPLSPEVQKMLRLTVPEAEPDVVIHHLLQMEVDLLWNGGIGTYVKASTETHADADDRSNDSIRVSGNQLRCRIIGEGGNLGCTQRGRIEAALAGVRLNTDAIDNSGGVDMSDHEVNLKILVNRIVARGEMTAEARNELLRRMTDEVAALVLADNDAHGRQLSRDQLRSKADVFSFGRAIAFVERVMGQSRDTLRLPTDKELLRRAELGQGLTRPELAVLSAWVKMYVFRELIHSDARQIPGFDALLVGYFPKELQDRYSEDIRRHMLANEIASTAATTQLIADAGAAFVPMLVERTGASVLKLVTAYFRAQSLARLDELRPALEEARVGEPLHALYRAWLRVDAGVRDVAAFWIASREETPTDGAATVEMGSVADEVFALQPAETAAKNQEQLAEMRRAEIPEPVAQRVLQAQFLGLGMQIHADAMGAGTSRGEMIVRQLAVARASRIQDVLEDLARRPATGRWDPIAIQILQGRFSQLLRSLVRSTPIDATSRNVDALVPVLAAGTLTGIRSIVNDLLGSDAQPSIPTLIVLEERLGGAVAAMGVHPAR
jgi:glutamate dehydrogenase